MKIIQIFNRYLELGGEEKSVIRIANHLELGGHQLLRFWKSSSEWEGKNAPSDLQKALLIGRNKQVLRELRTAHKEFQADVWIVHNVIPVISLGVYDLAKSLDVPLIQWLHNYRPLSISGALPTKRWVYSREIFTGAWRSSHIQTAILAAHYARARACGQFNSVALWVAVSEKMKSIFDSMGWQESHVATLHHSWDIGDVLDRKSSRPYFLFLGRIIEEKGIRFLVELFSQSEMQGVYLYVAGTGNLEQELRAISSNNIKWLGFIDGEEKRQIIRDASAILFPSLWEEPLSTIAYEAFEQERCLFSSDRGGMKEVVLDRVTGRVLPANDKIEWKRAIVEAKQSDLDKLGIAARNWLIKNVNAEIWNAKFLEVLSQHQLLK